MKKAELRELLDAPRSYKRDQLIREEQNKFILKTGINRRLFDSIFVRCTKKKPLIERRLDLMDKKDVK